MGGRLGGVGGMGGPGRVFALQPTSCLATPRSLLSFPLTLHLHRIQENGFLYVHTPIVTASDCEGAGEMFQVSELGGGRMLPGCSWRTVARGIGGLPQLRWF